MQKSPGEQKHLYIRSRSFGQVADPMALSGVAACAPSPTLSSPGLRCVTVKGPPQCWLWLDLQGRIT